MDSYDPEGVAVGWFPGPPAVLIRDIFPLMDTYGRCKAKSSEDGSRTFRANILILYEIFNKIKIKRLSS